MPCEFVNPLLDPQWNRRILEQRGATFFHSAEWARVLAETYGYTPCYAVFKEAGRVSAILPMMEVRSLWKGTRGVCLPFTDECGPLLSTGVTFEDLIPPVREYGLRSAWKYLELRGSAETVPGAVQTDAFVVHQLALESGEAFKFQKLRDSTRRNIQKSLREGVEIEHLRTPDAMDAFYALHCRTRRRHGVPPQPVRFFRRIQKIVIEAGHGFVSLARFQGRWIAGAVYFRFGAHAIYKFGASDRAFQHLRANNLVMWRAIEELGNEGVAELSLGRTDLGDEGLLQFKRGWGGTESLVQYHRIGLGREVRGVKREGAGALGRAGRGVARWMPLPVLRWVGRVAYRHMG
jgi:hypothetical protein